MPYNHNSNTIYPQLKSIIICIWGIVMATTVKYNSKKRTYTGTNENDILDASILDYEPIGKTNIKKNRGLTITGGNGDDKITGTDYNDTIKGGSGDDIITGGLGVDNPLPRREVQNY